MPLYEYEPCDGQCDKCGGHFQVNRPLDRPALAQCPLCKKPVRKVVSRFSTPKVTKPASISDAKRAGFAVLKKISEGEYERQ